MTETLIHEICRGQCCVKGEPPCFEAEPGSEPCDECVEIAARMEPLLAAAHDEGMERAAAIVKGRVVNSKYREWPGFGNRSVASELVSFAEFLASSIRAAKGAGDG